MPLGINPNYTGPITDNPDDPIGTGGRPVSGPYADSPGSYTSEEHEFTPTGEPYNSNLVQDSTDDVISQLAKELGLNLTDENRDYLTQYFLNNLASESAWQRSVFAEKNKTQWAMQDLQKAGLNPFLAISGMNAGSSASSSAGSVGGGLYTESKNTKAKNEQQTTDDVIKIITAIIAAVGLGIAAAL